MRPMGTYSTFKIGEFLLDDSGNFNTIRHHQIFRSADCTPLQREYGEGEFVDSYQAPLRALVTRLELLGHTLPSIKHRFSNPFTGYDEPHDISFDEAVDLVRSYDLASVKDHLPEGGMFPLAFQERLKRPDFYPGIKLGPDWDLTALLERLDPYDTLRLLAENPRNLDHMVIWDFMEVVDAGYFERSDFTVGARPEHMIVTEGTSDTEIIRHAFSILRPELADFFDYVDMEKNYPFGGHGNLVNFMKGLHKLGRHQGVVAVFDNDAAGVGALRKLATLPEVIAVKLPDLPEFEDFLTIGPGGEVRTDINGRAAAIECYLKLPPNCRVRWTNFEASADTYHGVIDQPDREKDRQRKEFLKLSGEADYPFEKINKVLDVIVEACVTRR